MQPPPAQSAKRTRAAVFSVTHFARARLLDSRGHLSFGGPPGALTCPPHPLPSRQPIAIGVAIGHRAIALAATTVQATDADARERGVVLMLPVPKSRARQPNLPCRHRSLLPSTAAMHSESRTDSDTTLERESPNQSTGRGCRRCHLLPSAAD